ncbi:Fur family transcriptional regulator [Cryptosporangium aurantiacum]|uniref:Fur family transcriptional regulator, ferric uptake regulator n=1 Tax=Cryptosporangium aurantiacum TaxID=134849 RepID=A0A1M7TZE8_9ACTN|nr:Fur family transcriptional regulator [Cryptosporangium aurantiacum]SHN76126.1 Fur family transcriptional regulator, ferric uptake regulator [Cryptosporangium aurantiacum]
MASETEIELREAGLRVTRPRLAVLDVLADHPHATVEVITELVRERLGTVSTQAVYDVLAACVAAGLVRRIEPAGSPARFERESGDRHHHLVCRSCGRVADVGGLTGDAACVAPADAAGYLVEETEIVFWGWCPHCLREQARD